VTTEVSRYQKGKTNLALLEKETVSGSGICCSSRQTDNHASTPPLSFLQARYTCCRPTNSIKALKAVCMKLLLLLLLQPFYSPSSGLPGWAGIRWNIHQLTPILIIFIIFLYLLWSIASCLFRLCAWQSICTTSVQVLFGLPLGLAPSTLYSIHLFTKSLSSYTVRSLLTSYPEQFISFAFSSKEPVMTKVQNLKKMSLKKYAVSHKSVELQTSSVLTSAHCWLGNLCTPVGVKDRSV